MRIIVMGTGPFAVPMFEALLASRHEILLLVTQPLRGGKGPSPPTPMRDVANARGVRIFDPENVNAPENVSLLRSESTDALVVADYGQILSPELLGAARHGGVNLHGSLLPRYRGAAPINWAIFHGERTTGVSVIQMSPSVDSGAVIAQAETPIGPDEGAIALETRLAALGAPLVLEVLELVDAGKAQPIIQDPKLASRARRLRKNDGEIDWSRSAEAIYNQSRAFEPWPGLFTTWQRGEEPLRLILGRMRLVEGAAPAAPGELVTASGDQLIVATGAGLLAIESIQPAGKKMLPTDAFLRGYGIAPGHRLGQKDQST